jgi:gamma-glutamyltranspeptidase/glutathione hydrolase
VWRHLFATRGPANVGPTACSPYAHRMSRLQPVPARFATRGMVAAIDHLASGAGLAMLKAGGSAVDAAVATSAVLAVTTQQMCGMGGDLWAIIHPGPGQAVQALNASGRAGSGADPDRLRAAGHEAIPPHDDIAAVPVPGCVDGWVALNERFGRLPLAA